MVWGGGTDHVGGVSVFHMHVGVNRYPQKITCQFVDRRCTGKIAFIQDIYPCGIIFLRVLENVCFPEDLSRASHCGHVL